MSDQVKAKTGNPEKRARRYDSSRRQEQARQNRAAVLESARRRFLEQGYSATTLGEVAGDAGVSVEMIYKAFANKAGLLKAVFDVSVAGDDEPVPIAERDFIGEIVAEPDARRKIERYTEHLAVTMPRVAPVQLLARDAAAVDGEAAIVWQQMRAEALAAMTMFADDLATTGALGVGADEARDILWTYHAAELFELLVLERGWSPTRYGAFLAAAIIAAVVAA
jgi:AcrR family transcriptional regulator